MNGVHDLGGMEGFGPVKPEPELSSPFHAPYEGRMLAMMRSLMGLKAWNIDQFRFAIERLPPHVYLAATYYQKWFLCHEKLVVENGLVTAEELASGTAQTPARPVTGKPVPPGDIARTLIRGTYDRTPAGPAQFKPGDRVRAKNMHPHSHTRLPRFTRGHVGTVERIQGCHVYPDAWVAEGRDEGQWLYTVVFDGRELWGEDADPTVQVSIEAFEPYLEPA